MTSTITQTKLSGLSGKPKPYDKYQAPIPKNPNRKRSKRRSLNTLVVVIVIVVIARRRSLSKKRKKTKKRPLCDPQTRNWLKNHQLTY